MSMEHTPLNRQRSPWTRIEGPDFSEVGLSAAWFARNVSDGTLALCVVEEPAGWHLSISFRNHKGLLTRYPTWDEIAQARDHFLPASVEFVMFLPKTEEYVALHDTTFHLHEHPAREQS
jgi:hypothetical protein